MTDIIVKIELRHKDIKMATRDKLINLIKDKLKSIKNIGKKNILIAIITTKDMMYLNNIKPDRPACNKIYLWYLGLNSTERLILNAIKARFSRNTLGSSTIIANITELKKNKENIYIKKFE